MIPYFQLKSLHILVCFLVFFGFSAMPLMASRLYLGTGAGFSSYSTDFKNSRAVLLKTQLISDPGLSIDAQASFSPLTGLNDRGDVKLNTLMCGPSYHFQRGQRLVPYIGFQGGLASLEGVFGDPKVAYGFKIGMNLRVYQDLLLFVDYDSVTFTDSMTGSKIGSSVLSTGFSIKLFGQEPLARISDISAEQRLREYRRNAQER